MDNDIVTARAFADRGITAGELRRMLARAEIERVRRGSYRSYDSRDRTPEARHLDLVAATLVGASPDAVLSHGSAAVLHGLPVSKQAIERVHVTRAGAGGGRSRTHLQTHVAPLSDDEIVEVDGVRCTTPARTLVDLARTVSRVQGVVAADRALALGLPGTEVGLALDRASGWPGVPKARRVIAFADAAAESPGESVSRVRIDEHGLPKPVLQLPVHDATGRFLARSDFGWPELRTIGEFDGKVKYGRFLRAGETPGDAVFREKLREDALRDLGWRVVRWTWDDLWHFAAVADRLRRAFTRSR